MKFTVRFFAFCCMAFAISCSAPAPIAKKDSVPTVYETGLQAMGYLVVVDGNLTDAEKLEIESFQSRNGLQKTGLLDAETRDLLLRQYDKTFQERKNSRSREAQKTIPESSPQAQAALEKQKAPEERKPASFQTAATRNAKVGTYVSDEIGYKTKRAVVIGIDKYRQLPLDAAVADAMSVSKRLGELGFRVRTLLDEQATIMALRNELGTKLKNECGKHDQVVIYFAGHGVTEKLPGDRLEGYILPYDVDLKDLYSTAFSMKELRDLTSRIPARHILFVFDSCYSGLGLIGAVRNYPGTNAGDYLAGLEGRRAVYMITAGKQDEVAREVNGHGLFTLHFLDGIAGAADISPKDGVVQASELGRFLAGTVGRLTKGTQNPQYGLLEGDGDFLFPLSPEDPIRLKKSLLASLDEKYLRLQKRKSLQDRFDSLQKMLDSAKIANQDQYAKEIAALDAQIRETQSEIDELNSMVLDKSEIDMSRGRYSSIRFLNTGKEIDILDVYENLEEATSFFSDLLNQEVEFHVTSNEYCRDSNIRNLSKVKKIKAKHRIPVKTASLDANIETSGICNCGQIQEKLEKANKYQSKVSEQIIASRLHHINMLKISSSCPACENGVRSSDLVNEVHISLFTPPSILLSSDQYKNAETRDDTTIGVRSISFKISNINENDKLLTFDQVRDMMVKRYGEPTGRGSILCVWNWKSSKVEKPREIIWEDRDAKMILSGFRVGGRCRGHHLSAQRYLTITLHNKSQAGFYEKRMRQAYRQASKIVELDSFLDLKKQISEMAEIERKIRDKTLKVKF